MSALAKVNITEPLIEEFMTKHGQTDDLPPGSLYVTDDFEVCSLERAVFCG